MGWKDEGCMKKVSPQKMSVESLDEAGIRTMGNHMLEVEGMQGCKL